jgi:hypothetical protein
MWVFQIVLALMMFSMIKTFGFIPVFVILIVINLVLREIAPKPATPEMDVIRARMTKEKATRSVEKL